jgi:hypothetical protein
MKQVTRRRFPSVEAEAWPMKLNLRFWCRLITVIVSGYLAFAATEKAVFERFLTAATASANNGSQTNAPDMADLQHTSMLATLAGVTLGLSVIELGIAFDDRNKPRRDALAFLKQQTGRKDLPESERAAIAYVIQDLEDGDFQ